MLREVERFQPDVLPMDIHLPHVSGLTLIQQLRRQSATRAIPIIAITAFAGHDEESKCREAGATTYIAKPVTMERLKGAVAAVLGG